MIGLSQDLKLTVRSAWRRFIAFRDTFRGDTIYYTLQLQYTLQSALHYSASVSAPVPVSSQSLILNPFVSTALHLKSL
jgi:hypothetical protein